MPKKAKSTKAKSTVKKATKKTATKNPIKEAYRKTQIISHIAEETKLTKKQVVAVFDSLTHLTARHLKKAGAGIFSLLGIIKFKTVRKPATKARKGTNPFTGEQITFKAKPARTIIKIRPLKKLKDMIEK